VMAGSRYIFSGVCCECGRIRSAEGVWVRLPVDGVLEAVTVARDGLLVEYLASHGLCPICHAAYLLRALGGRPRQVADTGGRGDGGGDAA